MGPLMKVADSLAKNILVWLGITTTASAIKAKKDTCFRNNNLNNFKRRNEWHKENCSSSHRL